MSITRLRYAGPQTHSCKTPSTHTRACFRLSSCHGIKEGAKIQKCARKEGKALPDIFLFQLIVQGPWEGHRRTTTTLLCSASSSEPHDSAYIRADPPHTRCRSSHLQVLTCTQDHGLRVRMPDAGCPPDTMIACQVCLQVPLHLLVAFCLHTRIMLCRGCASICPSLHHHSGFY